MLPPFGLFSQNFFLKLRVKRCAQLFFEGIVLPFKALNLNIRVLEILVTEVKIEECRGTSRYPYFTSVLQ